MRRIRTALNCARRERQKSFRFALTHTTREHRAIPPAAFWVGENGGEWGVGGRPSKSRYIWWVRAFQSQTPVNTCVSSDARLSRLGGSFCRGRFLLGSVFESAFNQMAPSEHIPVLAQQPTSTQTPKHTHTKKKPSGRIKHNRDRTIRDAHRFEPSD